MTPGKAPCSLLIVTVDRLPAWLLPPWGCSWVSMPEVNRLAARGVVFDRAIATSDSPRETLAAIGGGASPSAAGRWPLLAAAHEAGLRPALITDDTDVAGEVSADSIGVEVIDVPVRPSDTVADDEWDTNLGQLFAAAAACLGKATHRLVWCHATSLGVSWDAPAEYREAYIDPDDPPPPAGARLPDLVVDAATDPDLVVSVRHVMAGQLTLLDQCLARLVAALPTEGDPWGILLVGVRGLGLGLHGRLGPGLVPPFGELVHLPAILIDPTGRMAAQRYGGLVTPADLGSTLLDYVGRPTQATTAPCQGRSLVPLVHDWSWPPRDRVISTTAAGTAVATPAWLLIADPPVTAGAEAAAAPPRLYAKPDDFFELSDVADRCPDVTDELAALATLATSDPQTAWTRPLSSAALG